MKFIVYSVLLVVLLQCHGQSTTEKPDKLEAQLINQAINIRNALSKEKLIKTNSQFGFLLLGNSPPDFENFQLPPNLRSLLITNANQAINHSLYDNFLAAQPYQNTKMGQKIMKGRSKSMHSEDILLAELPELIRKYEQKHGQSPDFILLYSHYMPCDECTDKIIKKVAQFEKNDTGAHWFVAYRLGKSFRMTYINEANTKKNTEKLENNGITVLHVGPPNTKKTKPTNTASNQMLGN